MILSLSSLRVTRAIYFSCHCWCDVLSVIQLSSLWFCTVSQLRVWPGFIFRRINLKKFRKANDNGLMAVAKGEIKITIWEFSNGKREEMTIYWHQNQANKCFNYLESVQTGDSVTQRYKDARKCRMRPSEKLSIFRKIEQIYELVCHNISLLHFVMVTYLWR